MKHVPGVHLEIRNLQQYFYNSKAEKDGETTKKSVFCYQGSTRRQISGWVLPQTFN